MSTFKELLAGPRPSVGLWVNLTDPAAVEIALSSGFDWILQDCEHSPADTATVLRTLQIAGGYPTDVVVRPSHADPHVLNRLLDIGVRSLLVPMVETSEQARALAARMEFPPSGTRGVSSQTRGGSWGRRPDYLATARAELTLVVQIESARAVANAGGILGVEGVDAGFVGTADLAASMGFPGRPTHPAVEAAVADVVAAARAAGKPLGTLTRDLDAAQRYVDQGFSFVGVGTDSHLFASALADLRRAADLGGATATPDTTPSKEEES